MAFSLVTKPLTWLTRCARWLGCDRNPLRRTSDRIEARVVLLAVVGYVPLAMITAGYASHWVHDAGVRAERVVHASPVAAVVLTAARSSKPTLTVWVPVRWMVSGRSHTGSAPVPYGVPAGATARVWVDRTGRLTTPAPTTAELAGQVLLIKVLVPMLLAQLLALSLGGLRWYLDRQRLAQWDSEWWLIASRS